MPSLGAFLSTPHLGFIVAAFAVAVGTIAALIVAIRAEHRVLVASLARMAPKPVGREPAPPSPPSRAA